MATKVKKWKKEDHIMAFYYTKCGLKGLGARTETDFAEGVLGCSLTSLKKNASNYRYLMGNESEYGDIKKMQREVYEGYKSMPETDLRNLVLELIGTKSEDVATYEKAKQEKKEKLRFEEDAQKLADIFRKMGKDPNKMRRLESNEKSTVNIPIEA
jgi:hypothetical protein